MPDAPAGYAKETDFPAIGLYGTRECHTCVRPFGKLRARKHMKFGTMARRLMEF